MTAWNCPLKTLVFVWILCAAAPAEKPLFDGADPHAVWFDGRLYLYPTSARGRFSVYSSADLLDWQRHGPIFSVSQIEWLTEHKSGWAPCVIEKDGTFYFYYSLGPKPSHIGVAFGKSPIGPFTDSGHPLLSDNNDPNFEAIDPMVFQDPQSGEYYLYAGGSAGSTLRVFELTDDLLGLKREIPVQTPPNFTEGVFVHYRNGLYYLSYSHGGWRDRSYSVHYAVSKTPLGPWDYKGPILVSGDRCKGPGHHSFVYVPPKDRWYIFYHRWENVEGDGPYSGSRKIAADLVEYEPDGTIKPITMTPTGSAESSPNSKKTN